MRRNVPAMIPPLLPQCIHVQTDRRTDLRQAPLGQTDKGRWLGHGALYRLTLSIRNRPASALCAALRDRQVSGTPLSGWQRLVRGKPCSISRFWIRLTALTPGHREIDFTATVLQNTSRSR